MKQKYSSKKHPVLEYIFEKYYDPEEKKELIPFYLTDISEGYKACGTPEPVPISNTILDLTRKNRGIESRVPESITSLGYDLRKKTGDDERANKKFAGEFVYVGVGNSLESWLIWPEEVEETIIDSSSIPSIVLDLIRDDEGSIFSVIDYVDAFSKIIFNNNVSVYRVQSPMKWQPNEIDGVYTAKYDQQIYIYPVEAKALTTEDDINLDQLCGGFITFREKMLGLGINAHIQQIAIKMIENGIDVAVFPENVEPEFPQNFYRIKFEPPIKNWQKGRKKTVKNKKDQRTLAKKQKTILDL